MATDEDLTQQIADEIRRAKKARPQHDLPLHYVEAFRHWAPTLMEEGGAYNMSGKQVTELRFAVLKALGLRD